MKHIISFGLLLFIAACTSDKPAQQWKQEPNGIDRMYSKNVRDSFSIFVKLPPEYDSTKNYPVAYALDANFYFDIITATVYKYEELGILPEIILVGIGYKDFDTMDELRNRDYTYPVAAAKDSFEISGGGQKFISFIKDELIPHIDAKYGTDTTNRVLLGHSLGGYFTLYALQQYLVDNNNCFSSYIAASPSIHYADYYLLKQFNAATPKTNNKKTKVYVTYGGMEDTEEWEPGLLKTAQLGDTLSTLIGKSQAGCINYHYDLYSTFEHMDMAIPTFTKGLLWILAEEL